MGYWVGVALVAATIVGVAVGRFPYLRMNRATIAFTGATLLIVIGAISLDQAYAALDLDTLTLLFAMMILNTNLRRAGFFNWWAIGWCIGRIPRANCWRCSSLRPVCSRQCF